MEYAIDIDGVIGPYGYSKQYVRNIVEANKGKHIDIRISSFGGALDDALDIAARLNEHGDVTAYLYGYCASAATVIALGANKTVIDENAFYLCHKVMNWVDIWGSLNADQIQQAIEELETNKRENDKMDFVLARMYAKKSGKKVDEILDILKAGEWHTADEAKEYGFVDEIGKGLNYNRPTEQNKLNAFGLPLPTRNNSAKKNTLFSNILKTKVMHNEFNFLNSCLGVEGFEAKDNKVELSDAQLATIDNALKANADTVSKLQSDIADRDNQIAELTAKINEMQNQPAAETHQVEPEPAENVTAVSMFNQVKDLII